LFNLIVSLRQDFAMAVTGFLYDEQSILHLCINAILIFTGHELLPQLPRRDDAFKRDHDDAKF